MNVLYILGNGFDMAQGMKTSYPEFYQYLMENTDSGNPLLQQLKKDINADKLLWSDMEEAFGQFTSKVNTEKELEDLYFELSDNLQKYLEKEENKFIPSQELKNKFVEDFIHPEKYMGETDRNNYNSFVKKIKQDRFIKDIIMSKHSIHEHDLDIHVMTFNYTNTLEKLLSLNSSTDKNRHLKDNKYFRQVVHVHGRLKDSIIIGVDNEEQIANEQFRVKQDVTDFLIKRHSYEAMKNNQHKICEDFIRYSNLIILYGVSLGSTDAYWWELIGENLINRVDLCVIQYLYRPDVNLPTRKQLLARAEREQLQCVLEKFNIRKEMNLNITDRLIFITNSNAFKI